jgi:hypothetical protein
MMLMAFSIAPFYGKYVLVGKVRLAEGHLQPAPDMLRPSRKENLAT